MLENFLYTGYELITSSYRRKRIPKGSGRFQIEFEVSEDISLSKGKKSSSDSIILKYPINASATGYDEKSDEEAFKLEMEFITFFKLENDLKLDDDFFILNSWFFENFAQIALKNIIESTFRHTPFKNITISSSRPKANNTDSK